MDYRQLGASGLRVSTITLGTMGFAGTGWAQPVGNLDVDGARRQISLARDAGVNLFDTADVYSAGQSEEILGAALGSDRDDVLIATKVRMQVGDLDGPNDLGLSRYHIIRGVESSLKRLGTDHIDLYQVHEWDGQTPLEETMAALDTLVKSGKVRYIGASNYTGWQLMKALWVADKAATEKFVSQQIYYSLQARDAEKELVPVSASTAAARTTPRAPGASRAGASRPWRTRSSSTTRSTCWSRSARGTASRRRRSRWPGPSPSRR
jgi:aryl-alcohol dehydrogenase-like predicted oxidoreductase